VIESLAASFAACFAPRDNRKVWQWAEDEIVLSIRQTENEGPYSTALTPYVREPLEMFANDRNSDIVLCWGTQTGKTNTIMVGTAWRYVHRPLPGLWVMPSEDLARSFSQTRWLPMVDDCGPLRALKHPSPRKITALSQDFTAAGLAFVGSNSPANLASRPCGLLIMDEVDKFATQRGNEASALQLAENRTKSFTNPLRVKTSTPTVDSGTVWQEFLRTDQRYFMVPCPHCSELIRLEWSQVRWYDKDKKEDEWDKARVRVTAHYECQECKGKITDSHKTKMLRGGKWISTNPNAEPGRVGYHLNSLYAPWRSCAFGTLAVKWLDAQSDTSILQDFFNSTLALPWEERSATVKDEDILSLRAPYRLGDCPVEDPAYISIGADPGEKSTHYVVTAVEKTGEAWVIDYGEVIAPEDLLRLGAKQYAMPSGKTVGISGGLIDSAWATDRIYKICAMSGGKLWPTRGNDKAFGTFNQSQINDWPGLMLTSYVDFRIKCALWLDRVQKRLPPLLHFPEDIGPDFIMGLSGMALIMAKHKRQPLQWKKLAHDHYADALKLSAVLSWWLVAHQFGAAPPEAESDV